MAEYAVECVDKADGRPYVVRVHAETHQQAIDKASKEHVAGKAHRVDFAVTQPARTIEHDILDAMKAQNELLCRIEKWTSASYRTEHSLTHIALRAAVWFVAWTLLSMGLAAIVWPMLGQSAL